MMTATVMDWEPLPPRDVTSTRQQRRRARTLALTASASSSNAEEDGLIINDTKSDTTVNDNNDDTNVTPQPATPTPKAPTVVQRKPNRPGFNSYLKVILDDATMDRLHGIATLIQTKVQALPGVAGDSATTLPEKATQDDNNNNTAILRNQGDDSPQPQQQQQDPPPQKKPDKKKSQPLRFKPRSRASLHMTFFFGGEALCELPAEELEEWHGKVRDRLQESHFHNVVSPEKPVVGPSSIDRDVAVVDDDYWFDVTSISVFPPKRNNLVVAILEASPAWHTLHNDVRDIAKEADSQGLKDITAYSKEKWTAHITLGNIVGGGTKGQIRKSFDQVLGEVCDELVQDSSTNENVEEIGSLESGNLEKKDKPPTASKSNCLFKARTHGIAMGGPVPDQRKLDWDFIYKPQEQTRKTT